MAIQATPAALPQIKPHRGGFSIERRMIRTAWLFLTPVLLYFLIFYGLPIVLDLAMSLYSGTAFLGRGGRFIGLQNYAFLLQDSGALASFGRTVLFSTSVICLSVPLGLGLALLLNTELWFRNLFRAIMFFPYLTSMVILALVWSMLYHTEAGLLNFLLTRLGLPAVGWLTNPQLALFSLVFMTAWAEIGYNMVLFLAGLQGIPQEFYDAAKVDGANPAGIFRHVILPLLAPTTFFVVLMSVIMSTEAFTQIFIMTRGGPAAATELFSYRIWETAFGSGNFGYAASMALVMFVTLFAVTVFIFRGWHTEVEY
jgi:multiple sugar transport system permease protein